MKSSTPLKAPFRLDTSDLHWKLKTREWTDYPALGAKQAVSVHPPSLYRNRVK